MTSIDCIYKLMVILYYMILLHFPIHFIWAVSGSSPRPTGPGVKLTGNLVLYGQNGGPVWSTNTQNRGANDGNVVIYNASDVPLWSIR